MVLRFIFGLVLVFSLPVWAFDHSHGQWNKLLQQHVYWLSGEHGSEVDYAGFARDSSQLQSYLSSLSAVSSAEYQSWSQQQQLAFLINAYNAFTVELILTRYPDLASIKDLGSLFRSPWKKEFITFLGEQRSLDDIEHGMIRTQFQEPRIHFAVVCASIGCPALADTSYTPEQLDRQLDRSTRRFLSDSTRNYLIASQNTAFVSKLFDWYGDDFARDAGSVTAYLDRYADAFGAEPGQLSSVKLQFLPYDWALNAYRQP